MSDNLADTLADLMFRRARREIPAFRRVVIETSGLADPAPILHCLLTDRLVKQHYRLDGLVTVVDALHGLEQLDTKAEAVKQVAMADRLAISKTDLAAPESTGTLRARLEELNPRAPILKTINGVVDAPLDLIDVRATQVLDLATAGGVGGQEMGEHRLERTHDYGAHSDVGTSTFELARPATWAGYDYWVRLLKQYRGADLLRMKGVLQFEGRTAPYFVQSVQHVFRHARAHERLAVAGSTGPAGLHHPRHRPSDAGALARVPLCAGGHPSARLGRGRAVRTGTNETGERRMGFRHQGERRDGHPAGQG